MIISLAFEMIIRSTSTASRLAPQSSASGGRCRRGFKKNCEYFVDTRLFMTHSCPSRDTPAVASNSRLTLTAADAVRPRPIGS